MSQWLSRKCPDDWAPPRESAPLSIRHRTHIDWRRQDYVSTSFTCSATIVHDVFPWLHNVRLVQPSTIFEALFTPILDFIYHSYRCTVYIKLLRRDDTQAKRHSLSQQCNVLPCSKHFPIQPSSSDHASKNEIRDAVMHFTPTTSCSTLAHHRLQAKCFQKPGQILLLHLHDTVLKRVNAYSRTCLFDYLLEGLAEAVETSSLLRAFRLVIGI